MSVVLEASDGRSLTVNVWNWGVLHHFVANAGILPEAIWEPKRFNGGGDLDAHQLKTLADFLTETLLPRLEPGERILYDGSVTAEPDDGTLYRSDADMWKNYSLRRDVLEAVIEFLRAAQGSVTFY